MGKTKEAQTLAIARVRSVAFVGLEIAEVEVQVQVGPGLPAFAIVGLPDKAVAESRERVRAALTAMGMALPPRRVVVNLAPADLAKEGSLYDLPIALGLFVAMGVIPAAAVEGYIALGELALDGSVQRVAGVLAAAIAASQRNMGLICPAACAGEAAWLAEDIGVVPVPSLIAFFNHIRGVQKLPPPPPRIMQDEQRLPDLQDVKGQETAKRALEIAAAGGHNLLMCGPPGSGKSMLAERIAGILPPLDAAETLEVGMIASVGGRLREGRLTSRRPYRAPHHAASMAAMVGGGVHARPGEVSLAHKGVLFLDELPEFSRAVLESLRQPIERGTVTISRANIHVTYPARFQLVAAMNPCRCGHMTDPAQACSKAPRCGADYMQRLSGPLLDRFDISVDVPAVSHADLDLPPPAEGSAEVAARVQAARLRQADRFAALGAPELRTNTEAEGVMLDRIAPLDEPCRALLKRAAEALALSARGYHRIKRVARTIADLDGTENIRKSHLSEAIGFRRRPNGAR